MRNSRNRSSDRRRTRETCICVVLHIDTTTALQPLERTSEWTAGELPETYPYAV